MGLTTMGIVVALQAEAAALTLRSVQPECVVYVNDGCCVWLSGMGAEAAGTAALALVKAGATALMTFGVSGALDSGLPSGTLFCPQRILDELGGVYSADVPWRHQLQRRLVSAQLPMEPEGTLLSVSRPLFTAAEKAVARHHYQAVAVDMESAAVAAVAAQFGLPFLALRAVVDEYDDAVPEGLLGSVDSWGRPQLTQLVWMLIRRPHILARLPGLASQMNKAVAALAAAAPFVTEFKSDIALQRTAAW